MRSALALLAVLGFVFFCSVEATHEFKCLGKKLHISDGQMENIKTCHKEWQDRHPDSKDHAWQEPCFVACKFTKAGWVKDGKFDADAAKKDVGAMVSDIPSADQDKIKKGIDDCAAKHTDKLSTDDKCKSFGDLGKCFMTNLFTKCKDKED